jgi:hypothetical protein
LAQKTSMLPVAESVTSVMSATLERTVRLATLRWCWKRSPAFLLGKARARRLTVWASKAAQTQR